MADSGLVRFLANGIRFATSKAASVHVGLRLLSDPASSFYLNLPTSLPGTTQALTLDSSGNIGFQSLGGGGTVTSVALTVPSFLSVAGSPVTTTGTLAVTLATQTANTFFAGPSSGGAAAPTFRAIAWADVSALAGTSSTSFAAGNDGRFHAANTDTGTTQTSFAIDSGGTGVRLKNSSGALQLRNLADNANADLIVNNLTVAGTTTTVNSETVTIDDNIIVLNNNVSSGTPTEDGGIHIRRGSSTSASLIWDEANDRWRAGLAGAEVSLATWFELAFTNSNLTAGVLTVPHNLGRQYLPIVVVDASGKLVIPDEVTFTNANSLTVELTSFGAISGTWRIGLG